MGYVFLKESAATEDLFDNQPHKRVAVALAELVFKRGELRRKRRLRDVEPSGGPSDVSIFRHGEKVPEYPQVHAGQYIMFGHKCKLWLSNRYLRT